MAQIDASIPLGVRPVQMPDQMNALAKVMQIKGIQQEQALGQMKMDEMQRGVTEQNALRAALSTPGADPYNVLLQSGNVKGAMDWRKGQDESKKTAAETQKIDFDSQIKQVEHISSILSTARDPQSYEAARQLIGRQFPKALANMPAQFDPGALEGLIAQGQTITQRLTDQRAREQQAETGRHNKATETISVDNNKRTVGASYANASATREIANATRDAAKIKDSRDTEMKLADDYRGQSKNFKEVADAANRVKSALPSATKSAAATLTAATSFMKMLDPGSVVRESELGMALAATGAIDRLTNYHNVLQNGKVLTASQVKDFDAITEKVLAAAKQGQQAVDGNYRRQAQQYGLRPEMIVQDLGQNAGPATGANPQIDELLKKYGR